MKSVFWTIGVGSGLLPCPASTKLRGYLEALHSLARRTEARDPARTSGAAMPMALAGSALTKSSIPGRGPRPDRDGCCSAS
jgi:hypothetical protein